MQGWNYDLSIAYSRDFTVLKAQKTYNASLGPTNTQTDFYLGDLTFRQATTNFDLTREFDWGLAKPATVSFGVEHRWEH